MSALQSASSSDGFLIVGMRADGEDDSAGSLRANRVVVLSNEARRSEVDGAVGLGERWWSLP
jgi:hypothetical protein